VHLHTGDTSLNTVQRMVPDNMGQGIILHVNTVLIFNNQNEMEQAASGDFSFFHGQAETARSV
jgi:hypothetical protein